MTNVSPWIICTLTLLHFPSLFRYRALPFLTLRCGANFASASKPHDMIHSFTQKPPYIFLRTATIPTYYGISIAIPRYFHATFHRSVYHDMFIIVILLCMIM